MPEYQCPKCSSQRAHSHTSRIDEKNSVVEVTYECGAKLMIDFPGGLYEWIFKCKLRR